MSCAICAIGVCAPGIADWPQLESILSGGETHRPRSLGKLMTASLPATERRRANGMAHLALHVAEQAVGELSTDELSQLATVFSSAHGDGHVLAQILQTLAQPTIALSPTLFHNSVYNAPAGYWSIAGRCRAPSTTLCAGDASFAAGLIEACLQCRATNSRVLYVAVDGAFPDSLDDFELKHESFACALLVTPDSRTTRSYGWIDTPAIATMPDRDEHIRTGLDDFFAGNAAAEALHLLAPIARREYARIRLPYHDATCVELAYTP